MVNPSLSDAAPVDVTFRLGDEVEDVPLPEMVVIPGGSFRMGCLNDDGDCKSWELPVRTVEVPSFALSKYEVTVAQWDACVDAGGCDGEAYDRKAIASAYLVPGNRPIVVVSWLEAQSYVAWLSGHTGAEYRLPSEAEWEYAARAGTETKYHWGNDVGTNQANCRNCGSEWDRIVTAPVGSFDPNGWGLHDMHGNVSEWTQDCMGDDYRNAPTDGSASTYGGCSFRVVRSGSFFYPPVGIRAAFRTWRPHWAGIRVARTLAP